MKAFATIYNRHYKALTFMGYFLVCMVIFPAMTDIGWIWHFFGKKVMLAVDFVLSVWIAYEMVKGS